jgi:hypothetical protein
MHFAKQITANALGKKMKYRIRYMILDAIAIASVIIITAGASMLLFIAMGN